MKGCECLSVPPNHPNIFYSVSTRVDIEMDFSSLVKYLENHSVRANRVIIYCRSLNMCIFATVWGRKDIINQVRKTFVEIVYLECFILALLMLISRSY